MSRIAACALLLALALTTPALAADQVTADPDDAYTLAASQSDVRAVEFHTTATTAQVVVRVENTTQFTSFTWLDVDNNGRADYVIDMDGGSGSSTYDLEVYEVPNSTSSCQLFDPGVPPVVDQQLKYDTDSDGFAVLHADLPIATVGGATAWRWAAFGYTVNGMSPGWDYVPDATNPDPKVAQPADRTCSITQIPGQGIALDFAQGGTFPTPPPSNALPVAEFSFSPTAPLSTDPVTFTSSSSDPDGTLVSQRWDLDGDGQYDDATGATANTSFARKGPHTVSLIVQDDDGATTTVSHVVNVGNRQPTASHTQDPAVAYPDQDVRLTDTSTDDGTITSITWDFNNDGTPEATGPVAIFHTPPYRGTYHGIQRVTDDDGAMTVRFITIEAHNRPPIPRLTITPAHPTTRDVIRIDAAGSSDPDGDSLRYYFDYGSGSFGTYGQSTPTYSSSVGGRPRRVTIRVRVEDTYGDSAIASQVVDIAAPPLRFAIHGPDPDAVYPYDAVDVYGSWEGVDARLCVVTGSPTAAPAGCSTVTGLDRDGSWTRRVSLVPGANVVTAFLTDAYGQVNRQTITINRVTAASGLDLRAGSIEVTQGSQWYRLPYPHDLHPGAERVGDYNGVILARGGPTYARVFANARSLARGNLQPRNVTAVLYGYDGARLLSTAPLMPIAGPPSLHVGPLTGADVGDRMNPSGAYLFQLPDAWTRVAHLRLDAIVDPAGAYPECASCRSDNVFSLRDIVFREPPHVTIFPEEMVWAENGHDVRPLPAPQAFDALRRLSPGGPAATSVLNYYGAPIRIDDIHDNASLSDDDKNSRVFDREAAYTAGTFVQGALSVGVNTGVARGLTAPVLFGNPLRVELIEVVESNRPLTSVAHELFHNYGAGHASACTNGGDPHTLGIFGVDDWPEDQRGYLEGYALDLRPGSGGTRGPFRILGRTDYDFMSYCANANGDPNSWLSARNWNRRMSAPLDQPDRTFAQVASGPALLVSGYLDAAGTARIIRVESATGAPAAPKDGAYAVIVRDAAGAVISRTPLELTDLHSHGQHDDLPYFRATVASSAAAASIEITGADGAVLGTRAASATAPVVGVARPTVAKRVLHVAWTASDADKDALVTRVELASDGTHYKTVALDLTGKSRLDVPTTSLESGKAARVRVTVNDGFRATSAVSAPFALVGGKSSVRILDPTRKSTLATGVATVLRGEAITTAGKRLKVTWYAGKKRLGRGGVLTLPTGLPGGRVKLRLVASDGASTTTTVKVRRAKPVLTVLRAPRRVARSARRVTLRAAASVPATLRLGGHAYKLSSKPHAIVVRIGTAKALRGTLTAAGKRTRVTVALSRR